MPVPKPGKLSRYSGTLDCFMKTIKSEGPLGLYKGMGALLVGVAPVFAISFLGYGIGKKLFGFVMQEGSVAQCRGLLGDLHD